MKFGWVVKENYGVLFSNEKWLLGYKFIHKSKQRWVLGDGAHLGLDPIGHSARGKASSAERG